MKLKDKKIAILATDGFEQSELFEPLEALKNEGATVDIVSNKEREITAWNKMDWGKSIEVDTTVDSAHVLHYDALVLPGGLINPDILRIHTIAVNFVKAFFERHKPVAAICHAPWLLINADVIDGRKVTSYKSIKKDVINAGGLWEDKEVVVDNGLVTSRNPDDLPAFCSKIIEEVLEGKHEGQHA
ncbi:type 1 glutamine amidotransferase [Muricauda sp. NFXS6]|uniref:type 1 glutamine amidotransferase domain-containing protein n=1 Tax=Allomuricauda sp. NFXS6 TaxID=2819094 RepID=UPI0032DF9CC1